jgi:hypothetical protein
MEQPRDWAVLRQSATQSFRVAANVLGSGTGPDPQQEEIMTFSKKTTLSLAFGLGVSAMAMPVMAQDDMMDPVTLNCAEFLAMGPEQMEAAVQSAQTALENAAPEDATEEAVEDAATADTAAEDTATEDTATDSATEGATADTATDDSAMETDDMMSEDMMQSFVNACTENPDMSMIEAHEASNM